MQLRDNVCVKLALLIFEKLVRKNWKKLDSVKTTALRNYFRVNQDIRQMKFRPSEVDECALGLNDCHFEAICIDLEKGYTCKCKDG